MKTTLKTTMLKTVLAVAVMGFSTAAFAKGHARPKVEGVVNLNTASAAQLDALPGVAPKVAQAVQLLFVFTLAAGLVVLVGAMTATREARIREAAT